MAVNIGPKVSLDGWSEFRKDVNDMIQQQKTLKSEMQLVTSGFDENTTAQEKARAKAEVLTKQVKTQTERVGKLAEGLEQAKKEFGENDARTQKWQQAVNEATTELNKLNQEMEETQKESEKMQSKLTISGEKIGTVFNKAETVVVGALKGMGTALAGLATAAASAVVALGKIGLEYNMEMETYTTNFQTMLGSAEAAEKKVESLKEMAAATPFEMTDLADATQQLLAMGVASEDTNKYLQQLGDISLGSADKLSSLVGAFGKMSSTGKVTLEYINIMAEQGFNPLSVIAKKTGETMEEVYARVSAGTVTFDEVKAAIETATSAGGQFYQGMEQASKTTEGMISTLKDNATALVGEVFEPISEGLKNKLLPKANDAITLLSEEFQKNGVKGMVRAVGSILAETFGEFTDAFPDFVDLAVDIVDSLLTGLDENMDQIAEGASETVLTLADGLIDLAPDLIVVGAELIFKVGVGLLKGLPKLIMQIPEMVAEIVTGFADMEEEFDQIGQEITLNLWDGMVKGWDVLCDWFKDAWGDLKNWFSGEALPWLSNLGNWLTGTTSGSFSLIDGSHASGLSYVPYDGYIAELHQGEMVLTKSQAAALRRNETAYVGTTVNYGGFKFYIYASEGQDVEEIADAVYERFQTDIERKEASFA